MSRPYAEDTSGGMLALLAYRARVIDHAPVPPRRTYSNTLANVEGDSVVIRVPIDALPLAMRGSPLWNLCHVTDARVFAPEFVRALNEEEEDGTTLLHRAFDRAMQNATDAGCEGVAEGQAPE